MKKKSIKKDKRVSVRLHVYGIFDKNKKTIIKVSLDHSEIEMEMALLASIGEDITDCEFDLKLFI